MLEAFAFPFWLLGTLSSQAAGTSTPFPSVSSSNGERGPPLALDNWGASPTCLQSRRLKLGERAAARGGRVRRVLLPRAGDDEVDEAWREVPGPPGVECSKATKPGQEGVSARQLCQP